MNISQDRQTALQNQMAAHSAKYLTPKITPHKVVFFNNSFERELLSEIAGKPAFKHLSKDQYASGLDEMLYGAFVDIPCIWSCK